MADEYIRKQDALVALMDNDLDHIQAPNGKEAVQILSDIPAADVVPVVRCRDCNHYKTVTPVAGMCKRYGFGRGVWKVNDFCSYGERREE